MRFDAHWLAAREEGASSTCPPRPGGPAPVVAGGDFVLFVSAAPSETESQCARQKGWSQILGLIPQVLTAPPFASVLSDADMTAPSPLAKKIARATSSQPSLVQSYIDVAIDASAQATAMAYTICSLVPLFLIKPRFFAMTITNIASARCITSPGLPLCLPIRSLSGWLPTRPP